MVRPLRIDPASYNGWDGTGGCWGCELDVDNMERILKSLDYDTKLLKTADATRNRILSSLYRAADNLVADDIFVFYYSGHGGNSRILTETKWMVRMKHLLHMTEK